MSQFNLRFAPTFSCNEFILNGQRFNTQAANLIDGNGNIVATPALTTEVIINDATKNQALFSEIFGNIHGNTFPQQQAEIDALEANVAILQGEVIVLQNEMNAVEGNVLILQGNVITLQSEIDVLTGNVIINANAIAELIRDTQFLEAPHAGLAGNTSLFWRGLQVYNTPTDTINEATDNGFFSYLDGGAPASQIQLRVQDSKNVFVKGSTSIQTPSSGLVTIGGNANGTNSAMTFNVGNGGGTNNVEIAMNGNINLKGDSTSRISVYTKSVLVPIPSTTKTAEIRGADEANVLGKKITAQSDDGGKLVLTSAVNLEGNGGIIQAGAGMLQLLGSSVTVSGGSVDVNSTNGTSIGAANGKTVSLECSSGALNNTINIGTQQGILDTGYTTINLGNANSATLRSSSVFIDGDFYLPKIPVNPGGWDNLMFIGLPTPSSGVLHGPVKSTFNPYFRSISLFCPEVTVNSFFQASGAFTVNVGLGAISLMTGSGGFACTCVAGLMAFTSLIGGIGMTTAAGGIALTTGAGIIQMTTGAAPIAMETNIGDILLKAGYSYQSTPELSFGSVYIQARDFSYITPDKGVIIGEGVPTPFNEVLLDSMNYPFSGNIFSNAFIAPMTGVFSNVFITPNSQTTLLNPVQSNLIYSNVLNETGSAFAILRNMDINGNIAVSAQATVPAGNVGANIAPTITTTNFFFPASTTLPLNANVKLFVYIPDTPNIANYSYSTWQANVQVASNISGYVSGYVEPTPPSYSTYMTVLGNAAIQSDVGISGNLTVANPSFPAQSTVITRNSVTTTGNVTCNTLNYTTLNPPIVIPPQTAGVDSIIAGTNITISPLNGQGNVVINAIVPAAAGVNSIIAGNGIQVSPVGGQGNVTVSISGSLIPPGGYLPIEGGTMTGPIYQFPSSNIIDNTIKKYRPLTSYQPPFPSIGPPTFTGEQLCFFNGDNSPEQTGFTGWFPQNLITRQPSAMTSPIPISALQKFYFYSGGNSGSSQYVSAVIPNFKIGDHIKGGYFPYAGLDEGLVGGANISFMNTLNFKSVLLHQQFLQMPFPSPNSTTFPELDYIYQGGEQGDGSVNTAVFAASVDAQGEPFVTCNRNPANGDWEGYLNFAVNETTQFMAVTVDSTQAVIYEYVVSTQEVSKLITVGLTSGTYAADEEAVGGIFTNPQRYATTSYIYFYGRFDTATLNGVTTVVNNIFAYNVDTNTIVTLKTLTSDPLYSATVPVGTNGRVNGVWVSQLIVAPTVRNMVFFWGDFTGPNQMGIATPPTGINWVNNGFAISDNDDWTVSQIFRPLGSPQQQYLNCGAGYVFIDTAAITPLNTQMFLFVGSLNGITKNRVLSLGFDGGTLTAFSTDFPFNNGSVGTSAITKVKNIQQVGNFIFFLGNWVGLAYDNSGTTTVYSIAATTTGGIIDLTTGIYTNQFVAVMDSPNTGFWLQDGEQIETTIIQTTNPAAAPINYLVGTTGYKVGNNGGGVLLFDAANIANPNEPAIKEPILGVPGYSVKCIPTVGPANAVQLTCSLDQNNFWFSQTFNSTNPLIPPTAPTVNAINGAFFAVGNYEMDKIVFSGSNEDYNSVSFIAGDVENGDKYWYWQAQVGALDYYAGATLYQNVTAVGITNVPVPTNSTWGTVLLNGAIASTTVNMSGFDIINANTITAGNILTLSAPNAVEVGVGTRRVLPTLQIILDTLGNDGDVDFGANNYVNSTVFAITAASVFQKNSLQGYFRYDDGMGGGSGSLTPSIIAVSGGGVIATGTATLISSSSGQNWSFSFPNDVNLAVGNYFFKFTTDGSSSSYFFYGFKSAEPQSVCSYAEAMVYQPVNDPLEFFNVYGNTFLSDRVTTYGDIFFDNPGTTLGANVIISGTQMTLNNNQNNLQITPYYVRAVNTSSGALYSQLEYNQLSMYDTAIGRYGQFTSAAVSLVQSPAGFSNTNTMQIDGYRVQYYETSVAAGQAQLIALNGASQVFLSQSIFSPVPVGYSLTLEAPISGSFRLACATAGGPGAQKTLDITNTGIINIQTTNNSTISLVNSTTQLTLNASTSTLMGSTVIMKTPTDNNNFTVSAVSQFHNSADVDDINNPTLQIVNNNVSTSSYPVLKLNKSTTNSPVSTVISAVSTWARDGSGVSREWSRIQTQTENVSSGNEDGTLQIWNCVNGVLSQTFSFNGAQNENNSFRPIDLNGNDLRSTTGNVIINATLSTGTGQVQIQTKPGTLGSGAGLAISGNTVTSVSAGGSTTHHMCITLPDPTTGLPRVYKIALLNP
tara:strand:+ start:1014 stop:7775 length:6762 start_codon:yes stop_codon:yes gene_type:complete